MDNYHQVVHQMEEFGVGMHVEVLELPRWARS